MIILKNHRLFLFYNVKLCLLHHFLEEKNVHFKTNTLFSFILIY